MTRLVGGALAVIASVLGSGCFMIGPDYERPAAPLAPAWTVSDARDNVVARLAVVHRERLGTRLA